MRHTHLEYVCQVSYPCPCYHRHQACWLRMYYYFTIDIEVPVSASGLISDAVSLLKQPYIQCGSTCTLRFGYITAARAKARESVWAHTINHNYIIYGRITDKSNFVLICWNSGKTARSCTFSMLHSFCNSYLPPLSEKMNWSNRGFCWLFLSLLDGCQQFTIHCHRLPILSLLCYKYSMFYYRFLDLSFPNTMSAQAALEEVLLQQNEYSQAYTPSHNTSPSEHKSSAEQQTSSHASNSLYETGALIAMSALCLSHTLKLW